jgi:hypothetical protein
MGCLFSSRGERKMMNLKLNKVSPILPKGEYTAIFRRYQELEDKAIITLSINDKPYKVWLNNNEVIINGEVTSGAQMTIDAIAQQVATAYPNIMDNAETVQELFTMLKEQSLNTWVTVYEDRLNNFQFYKPKNWDEAEALGL